MAETEQQRRDRECSERIWNTLLFRIPVTNETRDGAFGVIAVLVIIGLLIWGCVWLFHAAFG